MAPPVEVLAPSGIRRASEVPGICRRCGRRPWWVAPGGAIRPRTRPDPGPEPRVRSPGGRLGELGGAGRAVHAQAAGGGAVVGRPVALSKVAEPWSPAPNQASRRRLRPVRPSDAGQVQAASTSDRFDRRGASALGDPSRWSVGSGAGDMGFLSFVAPGGRAGAVGEGPARPVGGGARWVHPPRPAWAGTSGSPGSSRGLAPGGCRGACARNGVEPLPR